MNSNRDQKAQRWVLDLLDHAETAAALEGYSAEDAFEIGAEAKRLAEILRIAIAQPAAGEPVAWQFEERVYASGIGHVWTEKLEASMPNSDRQVRSMTALYATPPAAAPVAAGEAVADAKQLAASLNLVRSWERPGQATEWEFEVPGSFNRHVVAASEQIARAIVAQDIRREAPPAAAHGDGLHFKTVEDLATAICQVSAYEDLGPELIAEEMFKQAGVVDAAHGDEAVRKDAERYRWLMRQLAFVRNESDEKGTRLFSLVFKFPVEEWQDCVEEIKAMRAQGDEKETV